MATTTHTKTGQLIVLIGGVALGLFFLYLAANAWQQRELHWQRQLEMQARITQLSIEQSQLTLRNQAQMAANGLVQDPDTRRLIRRLHTLNQAQPKDETEILRLREQLRADLNGVWTILQAGGAQVLEVQLSEPRLSLLRMQQDPDPIEPLVESNRPLLTQALSAGQAQLGLESGPLGVRQTAVVPVYGGDNPDGPVIATLTVGFYALAPNLSDTASAEIDTALLIPAGALSDHSKMRLASNGRWLLGRHSNMAIDDWLDRAELPTTVNTPDHQQINLDGREYLFTSLPLVEPDAAITETHKAARIVTWQDISAAATQHQQDLSRLLLNWLLTCLATLVLLGILLLAFRSATQRQSAVHQRAILAESQQRELSRQLLTIIARAQSAYIQRDQVERGFNELLEQILRLTESRFGVVAQVRDKDRQPQLVPYAVSSLSAAGKELQPDLRLAQRLLENNLTLIESLACSSEVIIDPVLSADDGLHSFLGLPICHGERLLGVLALGNRAQGYSQEMVSFLEPLLATLGQLINALQQNQEKHLIQRRLERQRHTLRSLNEIAAASGINLLERLTRTLQLGCEHLQLDLGLISQIANNSYTVVAGYAVDTAPEPGTQFDFEQTYCSLTYRHSDVLAINAMGSSRFHAHPCYQQFGLESYIGVAVHVDGKRWGTLNFSSTQRREQPFDEVDLEFMRLCGRWISRLLEQDQAAQQREELLQRLNKLTRHLPGMVYQYQLAADGEAWFPYSSSGINDIYGITPEQAASGGQLALERVHPDDLEGLIESITESALRLQTWRTEYRVRHPLKGDIWVAGFASPELLDNGNIVWHGFIADITERKRFQLALASEQQRLARVIDATGIGTWEWDLPSDQMVVDERWAQMLGYQVSELMPVTTTSWTALVHPDDRADFQQQLTAHLQGATELYSCTYRLQHRSGNWVWIQDRGQVLERTAEGAPLRMSGTHADISMEMQRADEMRQARSFLAALVDASTEVAIMATDTQGNITVFNSGAEKLLGYAANEVVGKLSPLHFHLPSETRRHAEVLSAEAGHPVEGAEIFFHRARQGHSDTLPWTFVRKDGQQRLVNFTVTRIADEPSELRGFLGMATDITDLIQTTRALQKSESRFRGMVSNLPGAVYRCQADDHWTMSYLSNEIEQITGYPASDFIHNHRRSYLSIIHPHDLQKAGRSSGSDGQTGFERTYRILHAAGHEVQVREKGRGEYHSNGELRWYDGFIWDVTEQTRVEQLKSQFVSTVSHELRTPLTAISGSLRLVNSGALGPIPEQMQKLLGIAEQNSQRLNVLINDLLDMDKLAAGKMLFEMRLQPLLPILHKALELNQSYADQYQISQRLIREDDAFISVDALRLGQVLSNLLSNAVKFSKPGGDVQLSSELLDGQVCISVIDQGAGIPQAFHARLFHKFSQFDSSTTRARGGSGLGLAISQELIQHMGGSIGFESQPGIGSRFWCCLPVAELQPYQSDSTLISPREAQ
ncbi:MAG: PAS domain-containing protein [Halopseudomonas sp.]|uniref:PAS domain-containing protein n=1 Tax=Halopseudomonas sp. TaxID=2901191 RepID=UPI0030022243